MNTQGQPEALGIASSLDQEWKADALNYDTALEAAAELRAQHDRIAELEAGLVTEAAQTANYKLRAEQMEQRLDMANKLGNEAREELAAAKSCISGLKKRSDDWKWRALNAEAAPAAQAVEPDVSSAVDALVTAAFVEGGVSAANTEAARQLTEQRKRELLGAIAALRATPPAQAQDVQDAEMPLCAGKVAMKPEDDDGFITWRGGMPPPKGTQVYTEPQVLAALAASAKGGAD